jgi:hypothetical protein
MKEYDRQSGYSTRKQDRTSLSRKKKATYLVQEVSNRVRHCCLKRMLHHQGQGVTDALNLEKYFMVPTVTCTNSKYKRMQHVLNINSWVLILPAWGIQIWLHLLLI